jgi:aspartyl-tRNA(Asn)/glutamyl-tRNA(Gln) amidotransferase subunit A
MNEREMRAWRAAVSGGPAGDEYRRVLHRQNERIGAFLDFSPEFAYEVASGPASSTDDGSGGKGEEPAGTGIAGLPFAVKDNIAVEGLQLSCASRALEGLTAPYTATAVRRLLEAGAVVAGKTNMDEFGMGSSTDTSAVGRTHNPWDLGRSAGGSSGGSAAAVAGGMVPFALGSDTGGSVRQPAGFCGIYGFKPGYGSVSRYGLVAYASSLEVIGVLSKDLDVTRKAFHVMRGIDPLDQTTLAPPSESETESGHPGTAAAEGETGPAGRIGILTGLEGLSPQIEQGYRRTAEELRGLGYEIREADLPLLDYAVPAYYTIASAEASSNLARYTGIRYGYRNVWADNPRVLVETSRDESLGAEVKLRILLGTYVLRSGFRDQWYLRAQKIRSAIRRDFERVFREVDLLLMPVYPVQAFEHDSSELDPFAQKLADKFTASANLAGLPALAFPADITAGLPVGMQLLAPVFGEEQLFRTARSYRNIFEPRLAPGAWEPAQTAEGQKEGMR